MEIVGMDDEVRFQLKKMMSAKLCSCITGQVSLSCSVMISAREKVFLSAFYSFSGKFFERVWLDTQVLDSEMKWNCHGKAKLRVVEIDHVIVTR